MLCMTCVLKGCYARYFNKSGICSFGHIMPVLKVRGK